MKRCLRKHRLTSERRRRKRARQFYGPSMMLVGTVLECNDKARIGNDFHEREYPLRLERFLGPFTVPAYFIQIGSISLLSVLSNDSRTTRPSGRPVLRDFSLSRFSRSSGKRTVSVLLICHGCNTPHSQFH